MGWLEESKKVGFPIRMLRKLSRPNLDHPPLALAAAWRETLICNFLSSHQFVRPSSNSNSNIERNRTPVHPSSISNQQQQTELSRCPYPNQKRKYRSSTLTASPQLLSGGEDADNVPSVAVKCQSVMEDGQFSAVFNTFQVACVAMFAFRTCLGSIKIPCIRLCRKPLPRCWALPPIRNLCRIQNSSDTQMPTVMSSILTFLFTSHHHSSCQRRN